MARLFEDSLIDNLIEPKGIIREAAFFKARLVSVVIAKCCEYSFQILNSADRLPWARDDNSWVNDLVAFIEDPTTPQYFDYYNIILECDREKARKKAPRHQPSTLDYKTESEIYVEHLAENLDTFIFVIKPIRCLYELLFWFSEYDYRLVSGFLIKIFWKGYSKIMLVRND